MLNNEYELRYLPMNKNESGNVSTTSRLFFLFGLLSRNGMSKRYERKKRMLYGINPGDYDTNIPGAWRLIQWNRKKHC